LSEGPAQYLQLDPAWWFPLFGGPQAETVNQISRRASETTAGIVTWVSGNENSSTSLSSEDDGSSEDSSEDAREEHCV
jgi:hypothetical protein